MIIGYNKMDLAWAISICYMKFPQRTMKYLKNNRLAFNNVTARVNYYVHFHFNGNTGRGLCFLF